MPSHVDTKKCVGCGTCEEKCPSQAITMDDLKPIIDEKKCTECGICVIECPAGAREIIEILRA
jgi:ferredoxin